jgi:murein DD-endopeptidase MepM/ murein hydrolase activator NlpD
MSSIQSELDEVAALVETAHSRSQELENQQARIKRELRDLKKENDQLRAEAVERAAALYMAGDAGMVEALFSSADFAEMSDNAEILSRVSQGDIGVFVRLSRSEKRYKALQAELAATIAEHAAVAKELKQRAAALQVRLDDHKEDYAKAVKKLGLPATVGGVSTSLMGSGGMFCPVAGPVSFVDSWGAPRSGGRSHQGVDMMGGRGTPQVAIVSGSITYAGYSSLGGNVQYLSGSDGNLYVYVHQSSHAVTSGPVKAGQVISYVGDTGNARGNPHLHFEVRPGGGSPVNPYPLVASLCR